MARYQTEEVAAMLDDDSDWNDSDEEAKRDEMREASDDYDGGEEEYEGLEGYLGNIRYFFVLLLRKGNIF